MLCRSAELHSYSPLVAELSSIEFPAKTLKTVPLLRHNRMHPLEQ